MKPQYPLISTTMGRLMKDERFRAKSFVALEVFSTGSAIRVCFGCSDSGDVCMYVLYSTYYPILLTYWHKGFVLDYFILQIEIHDSWIYHEGSLL